MLRERSLLHALETIKEWNNGSKIYPPFYNTFFFHWTLLNMYYNAYSSERWERDRVLDFGRRSSGLWNNRIAQLAKKLVSQECVGKGQGPEDAPEEVKRVSQEEMKWIIEQIPSIVTSRGVKDIAFIVLQNSFELTKKIFTKG